MITTPGHGTFPMGHATQTYAVGHVLKELLNLDPGYPTVIEQLDRQAARIATNRVIAGVHFPVDSMAGRMLGVALGEYFVGRCTGNTAPQKFMNRKFIAGDIDTNPTTDFNPFNAHQNLDQPASTAEFYSYYPDPSSIPYSPLMEYVWNMAKAEWAAKFP
jgi:hypothetical protein